MNSAAADHIAAQEARLKAHIRELGGRLPKPLDPDPFKRNTQLLQHVDKLLARRRLKRRA